MRRHDQVYLSKLEILQLFIFDVAIVLACPKSSCLVYATQNGTMEAAGPGT